MRVWSYGFAISVLMFLRFLVSADADWSSATCPAVSIKDSFLGFGDLGFGEGDGNGVFPVSIVEGGEVSLQKALHMVYSDNSKYVALLFYASWCPFSRAFRPTFSILASLYPSISHLAIEESAVRPSILSKYGVHGFPALFILNSSMRAQYRGHRSLSPVAAFYSDITRIQSTPQHESATGMVGRLCNYEKTDEEENCPFSWARSPENFFRPETYLALATAFVLLRLACIIIPYVFSFTRFLWTRHADYVRLTRLWDRPRAYLNRLTWVKDSSGEPRRRSSLQERAKAARTWASKSLASAVPIGDANTGAGLVEGQGSVD